MSLDQFNNPAALEAAALQALGGQDYALFERRVIQLKALFHNNSALVPTEATYKALGLYLLYLLACDRIADFHTELEGIPSHQQSNMYIKYPIQLERSVMEGNYVKAINEKHDAVFDVLYQKLRTAIEAKQHQSREASSSVGRSAAPGTSQPCSIDSVSAMDILGNMIGYATDLERIVCIDLSISKREEVSLLRRKLTAAGIEWDLTWSRERLRSSLESCAKSSSSHLNLPQLSLRYQVIHLNIHRVVCYDRSLLVGHSKIRITLTCDSNRPPISLESPLPFQPGKLIPASEGTFRLLVPLNVLGSNSQFSEWRIEFEFLHKFHAAPIYTVLARSWLDPSLLLKASAIDLFGVPTSTATLPPCAAVVRIEFDSHGSSHPVNLFRVIAKSVIAIIRIRRSLRESRMSQLEQLEKQARAMEAKSGKEREQLQLDLMMRTIETMNKYMLSGSKPDDWVKSLQKVGVIPMAGAESAGRLDAVVQQLAEMKAQIGLLVNREDVRSVNSVQYVQAVPVSPTAAALPAGSGVAGSSSTGTNFGSLFSVAPLINAISSVTAPSPNESTATAAIRSTPKEVEPDETLQSEAEEVPSESSSIHDPLAPPVQPSLPAVKSAAIAVPSPPVSKAPTVALRQSGIVKATPPPPKGLAKKAPVPTKAGVPVKAKVGVPAAPTAASQAKANLIAAQAKAAFIQKLKEMEVKRKQEMIQAEAEVAKLAKALPPIDRSRFLGLPGPPPFAPKKAAPIGPTGGMPSVIGKELEGEVIDDIPSVGDEQVEQTEKANGNEEVAGVASVAGVMKYMGW